jgi:hypothetical protein
MPNGQVQTFSGNAWQDPNLDAALKAGGVPLDAQGHDVHVTPNVNGGYLFNGQPINQFMGAGLFPGQAGALSAYNNGFQNPGSNNAEPGSPGASGAPGAPGQPNTNAWSGGVTGGGVTRGDVIHNPNDPNGIFDMYGPTQIGNINLPDNPQIQPYWMNPAQMDLSGVPQTTAQTPQMFDQLQFLLSGQGYDPATLAKMKANATDTLSRQGANLQGQARLSAEQAGLQNSPGQLALQAQAARRAGDATTSALNQLDVQNAQTGLENLRQGVPLELQRTTTGAGMQNETALANAARLFSAMQGNVQNVQQANSQNSNIGTQTSANNVTNTINRNLNQAQLNRAGDQFNAGVYENRYGQSFNGMLGLINGQNPSSTNNTAAGIGSNYTPNLGYGNLFSNISNQYLNPNGTKVTTT